MSRLTKILVAEDDHTIAHVVQRVLEDTQLYQVHWVTDGDALLESLEKEAPDLILLDLMMPKRNGFEVCRALQDDPTTRDIPVCIMTALTDDQAHQTARDAGADEILMKPFRANALREVVRRLLPAQEPTQESGAEEMGAHLKVSSWGQLIAELRQLCRSFESQFDGLEQTPLLIGQFKKLIEQAERRLMEALAEKPRSREIDLRARFRAWSKRSFKSGTFSEADLEVGEGPESYLAEVDEEILDAFLESLGVDLARSLSIAGGAKVSARRNGQTLVFRCQGELPDPQGTEGRLSPLSVGLSQLLGASLSLERGKSDAPVYLVYFRASRRLASVRSEDDLGNSRLEQAWSGLLVSVKVLFQTPTGQIAGALKALGPRGAILESGPVLEQALGHLDGQSIGLTFPEFGDCEAQGVLHRRSGEWAILWRDVDSQAASVLREIRRSAPGGGFFDD